MSLSDEVLTAMGFDLNPIPFRTAAKTYVEAKIGSGRQERTIHNMAFILGKHLGARWGNRPIQSITPQDCQDWQNDMVKEKLQNSTLRLRYVVAKGFFNWCLRRRWIIFNPLAAVDAPMLVYKPPRTLSPEEVRGIFDKLEEQQDKWAFGFLVATGLRKSEMKKLEFTDLTPEGLMLQKRKCRDWLSLPISGHLRAHLEAMKAGRSGGPIWAMGLKTLTENIQEAGEALDPNLHVTLHRLRHTCASFMVAAKVPILEVKNWLGHSSVTTTEKYSRLVIKDWGTRYNLLPQTIKEWQPMFQPK